MDGNGACKTFFPFHRPHSRRSESLDTGDSRQNGKSGTQGLSGVHCMRPPQGSRKTPSGTRLHQVPVKYPEKAVLAEQFFHVYTCFLNFSAIGSQDKKMVIEN